MNKIDDDSAKLFFAQMTTPNIEILRFFDGGTLHVFPSEKHAEMFYKERIQPVFCEVDLYAKTTTEEK